MSAVFRLSLRQINNLGKGKSANLKNEQLVTPENKHNREVEISLSNTELNRLERSLKAGKGFRITPDMLHNRLIGGGVDDKLHLLNRKIRTGFKNLGSKIEKGATKKANQVGSKVEAGVTKKANEVGSKVEAGVTKKANQIGANVEKKANEVGANFEKKGNQIGSAFEGSYNYAVDNVNRGYEKAENGFNRGLDNMEEDVNAKMARLREMKAVKAIDKMVDGGALMIRHGKIRGALEGKKGLDAAFNIIKRRLVDPAIMFATKNPIAGLTLLATGANDEIKFQTGKNTGIDSSNIKLVGKIAGVADKIQTGNEAKLSKQMESVPVGGSFRVAGGSFKPITGKGQKYFKVGNVHGRGFRPV